MAQEITPGDLADARAKAGTGSNQSIKKPRVLIPVFLAGSLEMDPRKSVKVS